MRYAATLTIPANTTEDDPVEENLELCYGRIDQVFILFPPGHAGLTYLQVFRHGRQILPTTFGESFRGDDTVYVFPERTGIYEAPFEVLLRGWNLDDTYQHSIYVEFSMLPPEFLMPVVVPPPALPEGV